MSGFTQNDAHMQIVTELPFDQLLLGSIHGEESLSRPFRYKVALLSPDPKRQFDPNRMNGMHVALGVQKSEHALDLFWRTGFMRNFQAGPVKGDFRVHRAEVVPWIAFMNLSTDFRIFQDKTVIEVLEAVLGEFAATPPSATMDWKHFDLDSLKGSAAKNPGLYPKLEYCVQCRETALAFVSRLMEEYGILYYFDHLENGHTMVLRDNMQFTSDALQHEIGFAAESKQGARFDGVVSGWTHVYDIMPGSWSIGNFSFTFPPVPIQGESPPTQGLPGAQYNRYWFPERPLDNNAADARAKQQLEEEQVNVHLVTAGSDDCVSFLPGFRFHLDPEDRLPNEHPNTYLITSAQWTATESVYDVGGSLGEVLVNDLASLWTWDSQKALWLGVANNQAQNTPGWMTDSPHIYKLWNDVIGQLLAWGLGGLLSLIPAAVVKLFQDWLGPKFTFHTDIIALPATVPFRPPRTTPRPEISGPHLALVVGSQGLHRPGGHDLCQDQWGRVHVKFPWDREHEVTDADTSAWIRVAEFWAGSQWGSQFPPRVGQEVIVQFIDGDPDRPIITGRLYNGVARQPFNTAGQAASEDLQGEPAPDSAKPQPMQTRSGIKTQSTPQPDNEAHRFHMLRFDDARHKEQLLARSQGRMDVTALASRFETTQGSRHVLVESGKDTGGGGAFTSISGEYDLHISKRRYENVDSTWHTTVKGYKLTQLDESWAVYADNSAVINADSIILNAARKITLKVGGSSVVVTPMAVWLDGALVKTNSGGSPDSTPDVQVDDALDAAKADPGEPPDWLARQPKGGGGRHHHTAKAASAPLVTLAPDGKLRLDPYPIYVDPSDPRFAEGVVDDYEALSKTQDGSKLLDDLAKANKPVVITKPDPPTDPPGAWVKPDDPNAAATPGKGSGSSIAYDPAAHPNADDPTPSDQVLQRGLQGADDNAKGTNGAPAPIPVPVPVP